jgi:hypothetical protein
LNSRLWRNAARCLVLAAGAFLAACAPGFPSLPALAPIATPASPLPLSTATAAATSTPVIAPTSSPTATLTFTPIPSLTPTAVVETALTPGAGATGSPAASFTPVVLGTLQATGTATLVEPISLDKLPPDTVYKRVRIDNESRAQMDISLHCTTHQGLHTILEYTNVRNLTIEAPEGDYVYVVYVGGRQIVGTFSLRHVPSVYITVYKDHVTVR